MLRLLCVCLTLWWLPAYADQKAPALDDLFVDLHDAANASEAAAIESRIWALWLQAPDRLAAARLSQVDQAMQVGQLQQALKVCTVLVKRHPDFAEALNKRATIHYLIGEPDRSVADIRRTLALEPRHFGAISGLGLIFLQRGDLEAALAAFEQVLEISPQSANARRSAERLRDKLGREI